MDRAAIYCRVSTKDQKDNGTSLVTQAADDRAYCAERGYEVVWFGSEDATGADMERAELRRLRALIRADGVDVVVVRTLDRLSRNSVHQGVIQYEMEEHGARLELVAERFDDTPEGRLWRSISGFFAEFERERTRDRTRRGIQERVERGHLLPGRTPRFGYLWADAGQGQKKAYEIDPDAAEVVRRIFREVARGEKLHALAEGLTASGVPTPTQYFATLGLYKKEPSVAWSRMTLRDIIACPSYKGAHVVRREAYGKEMRQDVRTGDRRKVQVVTMRAEDDAQRIVMGEDVVPAIVDEATWDAANARLAHNKQGALGSSKHTGTALLRAGFVVCGLCGKNLYVLARGGNGHTSYRMRYRSTRYGCQGHTVTTGVEALDEAVWAEVCETVADTDALRRALEAFYERAEEQGDEDGSTLRGMEKDIAQLAKKRTAVLRQLEDEEDEDTIAELKERLAAINLAAKQRKAERDGLAAMLADREAYQRSVETLVAWAEEVRGALDLLDRSERRELLYLLGVVVKVYPADQPREDGTRYEIDYTFAGLNAGTGQGAAGRVEGVTPVHLPL